MSLENVTLLRAECGIVDQGEDAFVLNLTFITHIFCFSFVVMALLFYLAF